MPKRKKVPSGPAMRVKVTLLDLRPPVWRRLLVPSGMTLGDFHYLLQDAMGWTNSHLHKFIVGETSYSDPAFDDDGEMGCKNEGRITLADALPRTEARILYKYDFGDGWTHEIVLEEAAIESPGDADAPSCVDGARACPPEDCGGAYGYEHLLEVLADPRHKEYAELSEWVGGKFDPEAFDLAVINRAIRGNRTRKLTEKALRDEEWT